MNRVQPHSKIYTTLLVLVLLVLVGVSCSLGQQRIEIHDSSMEPGYPDGTLMSIEELEPTDLARGELVYFKLGLNDRYYVKRLIGLPGETVELTLEGVYVDGVLLSEPYELIPGYYGNQTFVLVEESYFVLGDNRPNSADSKNWGAIPGSYIIGRAVPID